MFWRKKRYDAPFPAGEAILGRTLPSLLDEGCDRNPNSHALNHWRSKGWQSLSAQAFRDDADALALGLLAMGLDAGDRASLFMHSDINFCIADMGCLLARLVNVPIYLDQTPATICFIWQQTAARVLIVSDLKLLRHLVPTLRNATVLEYIIIAEVPSNWQQALPPLPAAIEVFSLAEILAQGKVQLSAERRQQLRAAIAPTDLATILYTAGPTGQPRGAMLTHENISADILAAFSSIPALKSGAREVALSYLPLTHIFARAFLYGHLNYGHSLYFTTPIRVAKHLKDVRPTIFITVPRLLEKVHSKVMERGSQLKGLTRLFFNWALKLAKRYEMGQRLGIFYALQLFLANQLVFARWRAAIGGRLKYLISGGAALNPEINSLLVAAGIPVQQGYGLTETSSVICYNRRQFNRAGTVGMPIAGVKIAIADDDEILVKAPYVMQGYYKDPAATQAVLDEEGWFHTGDRGVLAPDGTLKLTGYKKNLFKLSTGKYVTPYPLESKLEQFVLVDAAIAVGAHRKFCTLLIFPNLQTLHNRAKAMGLDLPPESLLDLPTIISLYQPLVNQANRSLPRWSTVKRFRLLDTNLAVEHNLLAIPEPAVRRARISELFAAEIDAMYEEKVQRPNNPTPGTEIVDSWSTLTAESQLMTEG